MGKDITNFQTPVVFILLVLYQLDVVKLYGAFYAMEVITTIILIPNTVRSYSV